MFLMRMAMSAVVLTALLDLTTATPAGGAKDSTNTADVMQEAAMIAMSTIEKRDYSVHGCHNPDELGPAPSVEDCSGAIKLTQARQGDMTMEFNKGCFHDVSGNCTASTCPQLSGTSAISPPEAAQYMSETVLPECIAKGSRGWYMNRSNGVGVYLH